jgi:hypothetical protein
MIYINDHPPAHVHVFNGGRKAIVEFDGSVRIRNNRGFNGRDLAVMKLLIKDNMETLMNEWRRIHG